MLFSREEKIREDVVEHKQNELKAIFELKQQLKQKQAAIQQERFDMLKTSIQMITKQDIDVDEDYMLYINLDEEIDQKLFQKTTKYKLPNLRSFTIYRHFY